MSIPTETTVFISLGTSGSTTRALTYANFCTNFVHDGVSPTFTGNALLSGGKLMNFVSGIGTSIGAASNMTFSLVTGSWNSSSSYAMFTVTITNFTQGLPQAGFVFSVGTFSQTITRIDGRFGCTALSFTSSNSAYGYGIHEFLGNTDGNAFLDRGNQFLVVLGRSGTCPA